MDLKDFVTATLTQITEGVVVAQQQVARYGGYVNPVDNKMPGEKSYGVRVEIHGETEIDRFVQLVEFDVAVVASTDATTKSGLGVLNVVSAGINRQQKSGQETTSRIRFTIPISLPMQKPLTTEERRALRNLPQVPARPSP